MFCRCRHNQRLLDVVNVIISLLLNYFKSDTVIYLSVWLKLNERCLTSKRLLQKCCTLTACCPLVSHVEYVPRALLKVRKTDETDRRTDGRTDVRPMLDAVRLITPPYSVRRTKATGFCDTNLFDCIAVGLSTVDVCTGPSLADV